MTAYPRIEKDSEYILSVRNARIENHIPKLEKKETEPTGRVTITKQF